MASSRFMSVPGPGMGMPASGSVSVDNPQASAASLSVQHPPNNEGPPTTLPPIVNSAIFQKPMFDESGISYSNNVLTSSQALSSLQQQFKLVLPTDTWAKEFGFNVRGTWKYDLTAAELGATQQDYVRNALGWGCAEGSIQDFMSGFISCLTNLTVNINTGAATNYTAPYFALQQRVAVDMQAKRLVQEFADQWGNRKMSLEQEANFVGTAKRRFMNMGDLSLLANNQELAFSDAAGVVTSFNFPLDGLIQGLDSVQWLTENTGLLINMNYKTLNFKFTAYGRCPLGFTEATNVAAGVTQAWPRGAFALPATFTITDVRLTFIPKPMVPSLPMAAARLNATRPFGMSYYDATIVPDINFKQRVFTADGTGDAWGQYVPRSSIQTTTIMPKWIDILPVVTCKWNAGADTAAVWGKVANYTWTREVIMPGLIYIRYLLMGGQPRFQDQITEQIEVQDLDKLQVFARAQQRKLAISQQRQNYLNFLDPDNNLGWSNFGANWETAAQDYAPLSNGAAPPVYRGFSRHDFQTAALIYKFMTSGPNLVCTQCDTSLETLNVHEQAQLEAVYYSMPCFGLKANGAIDPGVWATDGLCLTPFALVDMVYSQVKVFTADVQPVRRTPDSVECTLNYGIAQAAEMSCGNQRITKREYIFPLTENIGGQKY